MTEDEAKTKWCPMVRCDEMHNRGQANRPDGSYNCIASGCMMWRWDKNEIRHPDSGRVVDTKNADTGYCGVAGAR